MHGLLRDNPSDFYWGATAIQQEWRTKYPSEEVPPLRTIGNMMKDLGLVQKQAGRAGKGASRYLCYPEYTIYNTLGERVMEADFVGHKFLADRPEPLHFIGFSFKKAPKLRYFRRISSPNTNDFIYHFRQGIETFEKPDAVKVDNAAAMYGSRSGKRNINKTMACLLGEHIYPVFAVPRKPFSQASIEGNNSVFARKFWTQRMFESVEDVERQLDWFNQSSLRYTGYTPPERQVVTKSFTPKVYFIRQVRESEENGDAFIEVLNEDVKLPSSGSIILCSLNGIWKMKF